MSDHCWHVMPGTVFTDGSRRYICCHCGLKAPGRISVVRSPPTGHGEHAPAEISTLVQEPAIAGPCAPGAVEGAA